MVIVLDTFPTSSVSKRPGKTPTASDECHQWITRCEAAGDRVLVPAISYYEVLRIRTASGHKSDRPLESVLLTEQSLPLAHN